ncbi:hypothetical protein [Staphylococcus chromogenes]|uniref:hypothetical protein n=1 Tax=Staphylococcus chromogenes TaxID=46126 RepID=UPI0028867093|nr:hypothetical protein [Staphylococcus chromogenes]MDT0750775.1 hypothetical protein [Staphylococcus chromogenes]
MDKLLKAMLVALTLFLAINVIGLIVFIIAEYNHTQEYKGIITEKYNKQSEGEGKFYIVLDDKTVIENSDLLFKGKFNSADIQPKLKVGDKVTIKTVGFRIPILSTYPILYEFEEDE